MKVFISYRREDVHEAQRIRLFLQQRFGAGSTFIDRQIPPGSEWDKHIEQVLQGCTGLICVIGDDFGRKRRGAPRSLLSDPADAMRRELELALQKELPVFPVIVGKVEMPHESELPESLRGLAKRQAVPAREPHFDVGLDELCKELKRLAIVEDPASPLAAVQEGPTPFYALVHRANLSLLFGSVFAVWLVGYVIAAIRARSTDGVITAGPEHVVTGLQYLILAGAFAVMPYCFYRLVPIVRVRWRLPGSGRLATLNMISASLIWISAAAASVLIGSAPSRLHIRLLHADLSSLGIICAILAVAVLDSGTTALEPRVRALAPGPRAVLLRASNLSHLFASAAALSLILAMVLAVSWTSRDQAASASLFVAACLMWSFVLGYWFDYWGAHFTEQGRWPYLALSLLAWLIVGYATMGAYAEGMLPLFERR